MYNLSYSYNKNNAVVSLLLNWEGALEMACKFIIIKICP